MLKTKLIGPSPENFMTIGGYFEYNTYHINSARLVEERKKERKKKNKRKKMMNNSEFWQIFHFKIVTTHCYYYLTQVKGYATANTAHHVP